MAKPFANMDCSAALARATVAVYGKIALSKMLGVTPSSAFSPELKGVAFQVGPHQLNNFARFEAELLADRVKGRAVFPSHHDDTVDLSWGEFCGFGRHGNLY